MTSLTFTCPCGAPSVDSTDSDPVHRWPQNRAGIESTTATCERGHVYRVAWRSLCQPAADACQYIDTAEATDVILAGIRETGCAVDPQTLATLEGARRWAVRLAGEAVTRGE